MDRLMPSRWNLFCAKMRARLFLALFDVNAEHGPYERIISVFPFQDRIYIATNYRLLRVTPERWRDDIGTVETEHYLGTFP